MKSLGTIPICFDSLCHQFHLVGALDFPYDGNDLLSESGSKIDFAKDQLVVNKTILPLKFTEAVYVIAPRTETIIECTVQNSEMKESVILNQNPIDSLLIANCNVKVNVIQELTFL